MSAPAGGLDLDRIRSLRAEQPRAIAEALAARARRPIIRGDGRLFIIAADHPARGALQVRQDAMAMADRGELLARIAAALAVPGVDGVLGTADVIDDLALAGLLDDKLVVGSMNRGGLRGAAFELDDRFTGYDVPALRRDGIDFGKLLLRIDLDDDRTVSTLEATARRLAEILPDGPPIMLEPFLSSRVDGHVVNLLDADSVIRAVAVASGLGPGSSASWLKLPVVEGMDRVMAATTLPTLLLGGDPERGAESVFEQWAAALALPGVRGLVVGRSLLYPTDGDVTRAVAVAAALVHGPTADDSGSMNSPARHTEGSS